MSEGICYRPSYKELRETWLKENNIVFDGDFYNKKIHVLVFQKNTEFIRNIWGGEWNEKMNNYLGKIGIISTSNMFKNDAIYVNFNDNNDVPFPYDSLLVLQTRFFNIGDRIKITKHALSRYSYLNRTGQIDNPGTIINITKDGYIVSYFNGNLVFVEKECGRYMNSVSDFKENDLVLVKNDPNEIWLPALFDSFNTDAIYQFAVKSNNQKVYYRHCISYKNNEHLCGTSDFSSYILKK